MVHFSIQEMQEMQNALQERYKGKWEPICPEIGQNKLLWMIGEIGEVIDLIKKNGHEKVMAEKRAEFVEEMADVLMYFNDIMLCYGITEEELKQTYINKFEKNMNRW
ncbi:MAG: nucleotide pyrophosphohydrolase [Ruminococcaceae bacterium]|nr:nucleotide pyrophosphohydrolase [Oscillospiraceae bacterium]